MLNKAYRQYLDSVIDLENDDENMIFYRFVKSMENDNFGVGTLRAKCFMGSTNKDKASMLNKQFKSVFTIEREGDAPNITTPQGPTLPDITILVNGVQKLLEQLKPAKAVGGGGQTAFLHIFADFP